MRLIAYLGEIFDSGFDSLLRFQRDKARSDLFFTRHRIEELEHRLEAVEQSHEALTRRVIREIQQGVK